MSWRGLTIGALAQQSGTTTKAIRYYEQIGLLTPAMRGENQYRYYNEHHVQQLRFIRRAQRLGLSLSEIGQIIELARDIRCNELRQALDQLFDQKIREYELKAAALRMLKHQLQQEEHDCACRSFVPDCGCLPDVREA